MSTETAEREKVIYKITKDDLPLCCPTPSMELWNMHPKVFLEVEKKGEVKCPYCGSHFKWVE